MRTVVMRDAGEGDFERIVALNAAEVAQTSAMDAARLRELHALASCHRVAEMEGQAVAFLLAMDHDAGYDNDNFRWFAGRLPRFAYIDRIVVDAAAAGLGIGRRLYDDLFADARRRGIDDVVCEYNLEPPNPASMAFHRRLGFHEIGRRQAAGGGKLVSMQRIDISGETIR